MTMTPPGDRELDIVVHGATGFVGALLAGRLAEAAPAQMRIGLSGRSDARLAAVRDDLGPVARDWPLLEVDSLSAHDMGRLAGSTRVVASTVGPYARLGLPLVQACAAAGTHYTDLTGEPDFMRMSIDLAHETAAASGARIVHSCGFDSIPSDLGVFLLAEHARTHGLGTLGATTLVVRAARGGVSGGTIDSMRGLVDRVVEDPDRLRLLRDVHALSPDRDAEPDNGERDPVGVVYDDDLGGWLAPFVMGMVNSRVVRRSNALTGHAWGRTMRYRELMRAGRLPTGPFVASALAFGPPAVAAGLAFPLTRPVLDRLLPAPGDGPDEATRKAGFFRIDVHTTTTGGADLVCRIRVDGDPGYRATAVMMGEAALALADPDAQLPDQAGVLTPSTGIGLELARRLRAAGHRYDVVPRVAAG